MTNPNTRVAVDLDDLERQLRPGRTGSDPMRNDPLAELARIVGQDDPFRAVLGDTAATEAAVPPAAAPQPAPAQHAAYSPPAAYADPRLEHAPYHDSEGAYAPDEAYEEHPAFAYDASDLGPQHRPAAAPSVQQHDPGRSRKGLVAVGAVLGVAVLGVAGALAFRGGHSGSSSNGAPPIIQADRNPLKVQPQDPGGTEVPDQNKQIYERRPAQGQTRVVNREEQPVDVQQAVRTEATSSVSPTATPGSGSGSAGASSLTASLGEPKRVRTVSIKPEIGVTNQESRAASAAAQSASTTPAMPPVRPRPEVARTPVPSPSPAAAPTPTPSATPTSSATPAAPEEATRAVRPPQRTAAATPAPDKPPVIEKQVAGTGGYAVQLAVRPSDKEARAAYKELQQKFSGMLEGRSPMILEAQVSGKTIYRIRVGPLPKEEASALCTKLQGSGGQCFVAKN